MIPVVSRQLGHLRRLEERLTLLSGDSILLEEEQIAQLVRVGDG